MGLNLSEVPVSYLNMRLRRGVGGRVLECGCLVGIYETYDGAVVATIDAKGVACPQDAHVLHALAVDASIEPEVPVGTTGSAGRFPANPTR
jgi:hypothetical protein